MNTNHRFTLPQANVVFKIEKFTDVHQSVKSAFGNNVLLNLSTIHGLIQFTDLVTITHNRQN
jgi:hypothetical protein